MTSVTWIIMLHQMLFQGMFFAKNVVLRRRLSQPIRGFNLEANLSIAFFAIFIGVALWLSLGLNTHRATGLAGGVAQSFSALLMLASLGIGAASLNDLGDSWRVGVIEEQQTELIERGGLPFQQESLFPRLPAVVRCLYDTFAKFSPTGTVCNRFRFGARNDPAGRAAPCG